MNLSPEDCSKWRKNKLVNPLTGRKIQEGKGVYKDLEKACKDKSSPLQRKERSSDKKASPSPKNKKTHSPRKVGKKNSLRKAPCQEQPGKYEWIVGKGCHEIVKRSPKKASSPLGKAKDKKQSPVNNKRCEEWLKNKAINPDTGRILMVNGPVYKSLEKECSTEIVSIYYKVWDPKLQTNVVVEIIQPLSKHRKKKFINPIIEREFGNRYFVVPKQSVHIRLYVDVKGNITKREEWNGLTEEEDKYGTLEAQKRTYTGKLNGLVVDMEFIVNLRSKRDKSLDNNIFDDMINRIVTKNKFSEVKKKDIPDPLGPHYRLFFDILDGKLEFINQMNSSFQKLISNPIPIGFY
jgi:hypothetical protein